MTWQENIKLDVPYLFVLEIFGITRLSWYL